jgi:MFS transporter, AAHS family, 4-hydroxybenzoate transporter
MSGRTVFDVSQAIERQKLGRFLVGLVVISWIITFFDGFDSQAIAFAARTCRRSIISTGS